MHPLKHIRSKFNPRSLPGSQIKPLDQGARSRRDGGSCIRKPFVCTRIGLPAPINSSYSSSSYSSSSSRSCWNSGK